MMDAEEVIQMLTMTSSGAVLLLVALGALFLIALSEGSHHSD
jgi:hypothetical protein